MLQYNRTSCFRSLVIQFSPPGPPSFSVLEVPGVNFFEEFKASIFCCGLSYDLFTLLDQVQRNKLTNQGNDLLF